ncbi:MAG: allantoinase AllB [Synergistaceae bacterium]|nr:allantoinase AllB [Synergistaceae bacterium]
MIFDLVVKNGDIVTAKGVVRGEIGITEGKISAVTKEGSPLEGRETLDAEGLLVLPGLIDAHSHAGHGDPDRENFTDYSRACAAGGVTTFIDMPLSNPSTLTVEALEDKKTSSGRGSHVDYALYGGVVPGYLDHIIPMAEAGARAFKSFTCRCSNYPMTDDGTLLAGMKILEKVGGILSVHAENDTLIQHLVDELQAAGENGPEAYLQSHPPYSEMEAIQRVYFIAKQAPGCQVHIAHVSIPEGMDLLKKLREEGRTNLSAETCPQYLGMSEDDLLEIGALAKCDPPVRSRESVERLWQHVLDGTVDIITSDHSPHSMAKKTETEADFWTVAEGCTGIQTMLPVVVTEGRKRGLTWERLAVLMAERPAKLFGLAGRKGRIAEGYDADFVLFDPEKEWVLKNDDLQHLIKFSPYAGRTFKGQVVQTHVRGRKIFDEKDPRKITGEKGWGRYCPMEDQR